MNEYLKGKRIYLSGAIEASVDDLWREVPKESLKERFGLEIFDPFSDPKQQWTQPLIQARAEKDYQTMIRIAKAFVRKDLCLVDRSDFLICYLPYKIPTTGSIHEIVVSNNAKKPTLIVCPQGKEYAPFWLWGFIPEECIFGSWEELYEYLEAVNKGEHRDNNRWSYIYGDI